MAKFIRRSVIVVIAIGVFILVLRGTFQVSSGSTFLNGDTSSSNLMEGASPPISSRQRLPATGLNKGERAPDFVLTSTNGQPVSLSDYRGRPVLLNFWMINCDGCRLEIPDMQRLYAQEQQAHKDFVLLGVNIADGPRSIAQFVQRNGLTYPVASDSQAIVSSLYALRGTPTSFFLDRQGIIRAEIEGGLDASSLQELVRSIMRS